MVALRHEHSPPVVVLKGHLHVLYVSACLIRHNNKTFLFFHFMPYSLGVEPDVTHQTSWLGSTGECGVPQNQVGEHFAQRRA